MKFGLVELPNIQNYYNKPSQSKPKTKMFARVKRQPRPAYKLTQPPTQCSPNKFRFRLTPTSTTNSNPNPNPNLALTQLYVPYKNSEYAQWLNHKEKQLKRQLERIRSGPGSEPSSESETGTKPSSKSNDPGTYDIDVGPYDIDFEIKGTYPFVHFSIKKTKN